MRGPLIQIFRIEDLAADQSSGLKAEDWLKIFVFNFNKGNSKYFKDPHFSEGCQKLTKNLRTFKLGLKQSEWKAKKSKTC
jgi:hypothetical protein